MKSCYPSPHQCFDSTISHHYFNEGLRMLSAFSGFNFINSYFIANYFKLLSVLGSQISFKKHFNVR